MKQYFLNVEAATFDNDVAALEAEVWAQEALMVLNEEIVMPNRVYRDFDEEPGFVGKTVNASRPQKHTMRRKGVNDDVTVDDIGEDSVPVVLNQYLYNSFRIRDGEEATTMANLVNRHLVPAVRSIAQGMDEILLAQRYRFLSNREGQLDTTPTAATILQLGSTMDGLLIPDDRTIIHSSQMAANMLGSIEDFRHADKRGDGGQALRNAEIGTILGFNHIKSKNNRTILRTGTSGSTTVVGAVNNSGGHAAGATTITVDGFSAAIAAGSWCTIDGYPQLITGTVGGATPTQLTVSPGLDAAVANDAVVRVYTPGAINYSDGYASGYVKELAIDGFSVAPQVGQMITHGATSSADVYGALKTPTTTSLLLDRPLDTAASNNDVIGVGPAGNYSFAFHRDALALVSRPLPKPQSNLANSAVANEDDLSIRVTITYDGVKQGHLVTVDMLCGVAVLNSSLGAVLLG